MPRRPRSASFRQSLAFLVRGQRVVVLAVAERGLRTAHRMRRRGGPVAAGVDAGLHHPGIVLPRLGLYPLGIATELPATGVALAHGSSSSGSTPGAPSFTVRRAPIASATSPRASRLWPLTSASQCGIAATIPPARGTNPDAPTRGLTHTIR